MVAPSTQALLTQWTWEPSVLLGIAVVSGAYFYAIGPLRRKHDLGPPASRRQIGWFVLSVLVLVLALVSPVDAISDTYLFSMHMIQHLLLATLWPPLVLLALPGWAIRPIWRARYLGGIVQFFTYPIVALVLFNLDIYLWHIPAIYDQTLRTESVHILEHVSFMVFGLLNWWPVLSPAREQRQSYPLQLIYLFLDGMLMMVLGILFTFAPDPFYSSYLHAPRLWGFSPGTDQQLGGLIMWYPGNVPYIVLFAITFYRWFDEADPGRAEHRAVRSQSPTIEPPLP